MEVRGDGRLEGLYGGWGGVVGRCAGGLVDGEVGCVGVWELEWSLCSGFHGGLRQVLMICSWLRLNGITVVEAWGIVVLGCGSSLQDPMMLSSKPGWLGLLRALPRNLGQCV